MRIRHPTHKDIDALTSLYEEKNRQYQKMKAALWCTDGDVLETKGEYFSKLIDHYQYIAYIAEDQQGLWGYVLGQLVQSPPFDHELGYTCLVVDFCLYDDHHWQTVGTRLLHKLVEVVRPEGAQHILLLCAQQNTAKMALAQNMGMQVTTQVYHSRIDQMHLSL